MSKLDYYLRIEEIENSLMIRFNVGAETINVRSLKAFSKELTELVEEKLAKAEIRNLLFDMKHVSSVDSMGLSQFVKWHRIAGEKGHAFGLFHLQKNVRDLLSVTKMNELFKIYEDESAAVTAAESSDS